MGHSGTGTPQGPFDIFDVVSIVTTYDIIQNYAATTDVL
jgi:3-hydroxyacyl-CoA dehydrogenase